MPRRPRDRANADALPARRRRHVPRPVRSTRRSDGSPNGLRADAFLPIETTVDDLTPFIVTFCGLLGLLIGSFLNVVIWRIPRKESIVTPRSKCPSCDTFISPRDNVPVLSWLALRGKCRHCQAPISARYPLVEFATGALFVAIAARFSDSWVLPAYLVLGAALLAISVIDLEHYIIPNRIVYPVGFMLVPLFALGGAPRPRLGRVRPRAARRARRVQRAVRDPRDLAAWHGLRRRTPLLPARPRARLARLGTGVARDLRGLPLRRGDRCAADRVAHPASATSTSRSARSSRPARSRSCSSARRSSTGTAASAPADAARPP